MATQKSNKSKSSNGNGANLGFDVELFKTADKIHGNLEPAEYKHIVLGLVFLKYISDAFEARLDGLQQEDYADPEDPEDYRAANVFWVPQAARWSHLKASARSSDIGKIIDDAMTALEEDNPSLKGVLPKNYARPVLNKVMLGADQIDDNYCSASKVRFWCPSGNSNYIVSYGSQETT